jgi:phage terminase large subunit-like protein
VAWVEYAADAGCPVADRAQWHKANPGLKAGFLHVDALEVELETVPEAAFRMYRLGQWVDYLEASWLPAGAWAACPHVDAPPEGAEVILGLAGTWSSSVALVGATLDGAVFLAWWAASATDDELETVLGEAWARWSVRSLVVAPRARATLVRRLSDGGFPVEVWPNAVDLDVSSSTELRRAIVEGRIAHDHDPTLDAHVSRMVGRAGPDGGLRLDGPADGVEVDAGRAMRMAWWRAVEAAESPAPAIY